MLKISTCRPRSSQAINQGHDKLIFTSIDNRPFLPLIDIYGAVLDENLLVFKINNQPIIQFSENLGPISFFSLNYVSQILIGNRFNIQAAGK